MAVDGQAECLEDKILGRCFWVVKWSDHWGVDLLVLFIMTTYIV